MNSENNRHNPRDSLVLHKHFFLKQIIIVGVMASLLFMGITCSKQPTEPSTGEFRVDSLWISAQQYYEPSTPPDTTIQVEFSLWHKYLHYSGHFEFMGWIDWLVPFRADVPQIFTKTIKGDWTMGNCDSVNFIINLTGEFFEYDWDTHTHIADRGTFQWDTLVTLAVQPIQNAPMEKP